MTTNITPFDAKNGAMNSVTHVVPFGAKVGRRYAPNFGAIGHIH